MVILKVAKELMKGLEIVFFIHFILGLIIGFIFLFIPELYCDVVGVTITDKGVFRLVGAASFSLGFSSFLAYRVQDWEKAKLFVQMELIWLILASGAMFYWLIFEEGPVVGYWIFGMFLGFLIAFVYFYLQQKK
jgi:hypothetical protein